MRGRGAVACAVVLVLFAGCGSDEPATSISKGSATLPRVLLSRVITPAAADRYVLSATGDDVVMRAPRDNVDSNLRMVFWDARAADAVDSFSCATWRSASADTIQEGLALRITTTDRGTRAILVTKNVFLGGVWVFNVYVWDSSAPGLSGLSILANVDLGTAFNPDDALVPLPWHVCARAVGADVQFKAWPDVVPEPSWDDPQFGATVHLPDGWTAPGKPGWYVGHVLPGDEARYTDLRAGPSS